MKKVLVIGLDCAALKIVFDRRDQLPNIDKMLSGGISAPFRSGHPPITIPAWMTMTSGKDAGEHGVYGFRHRVTGTYNDIKLSSASSFKKSAIWDIIAEKGLKSCLVGVPPSYPISEVNGSKVSCFMTPGSDKEYTYPSSLKAELEERFGPFKFDVEFRTSDRDKLKEELFEMTLQHFEVIKYLLLNKPWQFFMFVEIGVDRIQHAFWKFFDKTHHGYTQGNEYEDVIMEYYRMLDKGIGEILDLVDTDTVIFVVSDHGAKAIKGVFCINQWLVDKGYLVLRNTPAEGTPIELAEVDWGRTKVWAWGGYYSRVFFNVKNREKEGIIDQDEYDFLRDKVKNELISVRGPEGEEWKTRAFRPEELYDELNGDYPDLMVYFDDLSWRAAGTLGHKSMYLNENDTGPDDAVHDWEGVFVMYDPEKQSGERRDVVDILDFAPTVLEIMGVEQPADMKGKSVLQRNNNDRILQNGTFVIRTLS